MPVLVTTPPVSRIASLPASLNRYLSAATVDDLPSLSGYLERGAALVDAGVIQTLRGLRSALNAKLDALGDASRLRWHLELLATYFEEAASDGQLGTPAHREAVFALVYFVKGYDRIPDNVPEVGLLDDAMIAQIVLQRNAATLRAHWLRRRRVWPAEL